MLSSMAGQPHRTAIRNQTPKKVESVPVKRIPFLQREKAAYLKLRRFGHSINQIAKAFHRSTNVIHRVLRAAMNRDYGKHRHNLDVWGRTHDLRKLPYPTRMKLASFRRVVMLKLLPYWLAWAAGEGDKPP